MKTLAGVERQDKAMATLQNEGRVYVTEGELIPVGEGKRRTPANVWRLGRPAGEANELDLG